MKQQEFEQLLKRARESREYQNYLQVRENIFRMLDNEPESGRASNYWTEELSGFAYILDASPLVVGKLRHHSYHLTGLRDYHYRAHHAYKSDPLRARLKELKAKDAHSLLVSESPRLGGFGYDIDGALYNVDTLKFYEILIGMDKVGLLESYRNTEKRKTVVEIGSGWGGFAYQWKTLFPKTSYVLIDFPASLLFAAVYLKTLFPDAKTLFVDGSEESYKNINPEEYDFIFVPHYGWNNLSFNRPDFLINMVSFQEMTTGQVDNYVKRAKEWGVPHVYSYNRDHSPNNPELTTVTEILGKHYTLGEIEVLDPKKKKVPVIKKILQPLRKKEKTNPTYVYRHIMGSLKKS